MNDLEEVSKEEWLQWKANKVTKKYIANILTKREYLKEGLAEGQTRGEEALIEIGRCQALKDVVMNVIEDFDYIEREDEEKIRNGN